MAILPGTWPDPRTFRADVAGQPVTILNPNPEDALSPYPTGDQPDPQVWFFFIHGYENGALPALPVLP